jgi:hypothetical protein
LGAGQGAGTGETRGRVCEVAGVGSEDFVRQERGSMLQLLIGPDRCILIG